MTLTDVLDPPPTRRDCDCRAHGALALAVGFALGFTLPYWIALLLVHGGG